MPRYYVREFYMKSILEKKLVGNLLRGSGENASTTKKQQNAQSLRNSGNMMTVTISN